MEVRKPTHNKGFAKLGVSCFNNSLEVNKTFVFQIKHYKSPGQQPNIK
jgi:hypothetical protein